MIMEDFEDLFDDAPIDEEVPGKELDSLFEEETPIDSIFEQPKDQSSLITELLKARGIADSKVVLIDEQNNEKEVSFFDLSKEEQLEILNPQSEEAPASTLAEDEESLIKYLRDNKITLQQYLDLFKEETLASVAGEKEVSYDIDAYDDEELFLLDLKSRYDDLTDEELVKELEKELENKELFTKKVTKLRSDYKQLEDTYKEEQQKEFNAQATTRYNEFVDQMVDIAVKTPDLYGIELEDDEKNNVLSFLLELDEAGSSNFYKALDDPNNLYKAAWFLNYGEQAFEAIKNAYEAEIAKLKKDTPKIVVKRETKPNSIHDLF